MKEYEAAQETVGSGAFGGALGSSRKAQFWDQVVAMCCNFGLSVWCMSCCFVAVIWAYGTYSFGDFKGGELFPWRNCPEVQGVQVLSGAMSGTGE